MKAVVLAGGVGTRMRPLTFAIPKPLLAVCEKPILQLIIEQLREAGCNEIAVATGYLGELIRAFCGDGSRFGVSVLAVQSPGKRAHLPDPAVPLVAGEKLHVVGPAAAIEALKAGREPAVVGAVARQGVAPEGVPKEGVAL